MLPSCPSLVLVFPSLVSLLICSCPVLATGLFKYGVTHYEPKAQGKCSAIAAPVRPAVQFRNAEGPTIDLDEGELYLLEDHSELAAE